MTDNEKRQQSLLDEPDNRTQPDNRLPPMDSPAPDVNPNPLANIDPPVIVEHHATESEWLAARQSGIGASEAAAVLGFSKFASPYSVWGRKTGRIDEMRGTAE